MALDANGWASPGKAPMFAFAETSIACIAVSSREAHAQEYLLTDATRHPFAPVNDLLSVGMLGVIVAEIRRWIIHEGFLLSGVPAR